MQKIKYALAATFTVAATFAYGQNMELQPGYGFAPSVKELMDLDAKKARAAALGQTENLAQPAKPEKEIKPSPSVQLAGIYGHKGQWKAEVSINAIAYTFSAGSTYDGFKAKRITSSCIELQHPSFAQKLCIKG